MSRICGYIGRAAILVAVPFAVFFLVPSLSPAQEHDQSVDYQEYLAFFERVYEKMQAEYYIPVQKENYDRFLKVFDEKIYGELKDTGKIQDYVKWRSAAFLVDFLKDPEDRFSKFFPPQVAQEYEQTVLGVRINLGIEGELGEDGYLITRLEPRGNLYIKGLRVNDRILKIDGQSVLKMTAEKIEELLTPEKGAFVKLTYFDANEKVEKTVDVESTEYYQQAVFLEPVSAPDVFCLRIERFNRKTGEDMFNYLRFISQQSDHPDLIIDLRDNPGGPPLAAREISSFFLTPDEEFAYFQKRDDPKALLTVPEIPEELRFKGRIVILINEKSGSASELFSGVMKYRDRAFLMGENSAGQVFLKSMFFMDDESMLLLVTGRGHYPDGEVFAFDGVKPDKYVSEERDLVQYAANFLVYMRSQKK